MEMPSQEQLNEWRRISRELSKDLGLSEEDRVLFTCYAKHTAIHHECVVQGVLEDLEETVSTEYIERLQLEMDSERSDLIRYAAHAYIAEVLRRKHNFVKIKTLIEAPE